MAERFSEHYRIDQYLRNKNNQMIKSKTLKKQENILSNFPVGLIIIGKEEFKFEDKIEFINDYACKLFKFKENITIKELKEKFNEFIKLKNNSKKSNLTLKEIIFNSTSFNIELDNFTPFESTYSKSVILYIKINDINNEKYIVIDKYDKYIDERKFIELNLIKNIKYQYLHTLYHELNNPLNALLAISGENDQNKFFSSDISNSRTDKKNIYIPPKTNKKIKNNVTYDFKKERNYEFLSASPNKKGFSQELIGSKSRKKSIIEEKGINNQIPLLVNIIKIFIKNFILYLKTRADNLLMLKNEFNIQNETSDIMNAVEVSEYEKELTRHNSVKLNLEYIFNLYFEKFLCLFKYKEIDFETNFDKLRNIYVITDEFNFIYYIRQIYTYLYYIIPKKEGFIFDYKEDKENKKIQIIIKKKYVKTTSESCIYFSNDKNRKNDITQAIQTKEMTKEVLYSMSKKLNFSLDIFDLENSVNSNNNKNENIYLKISMPIEVEDKIDEEDNFKDEEINEMIQNDNFLLEDKLKRIFPNCHTLNRRKTNNSFSNISSKDGNNNSESSIEIQKNETRGIINSNTNIKTCLENNINNEIQKKQILINNQIDNFLNKCLKYSDNKISEKENKIKDFDQGHKNKKDYLLKLKKYNPKVKNHSSDKNTIYMDKSSKNELDIKSQKLSGVFTKINNLGFSEELDFKDMCISNISENINKNDKREIIPKNKSKDKNLKENDNNMINKIKKNIYTQNSRDIKSTLQQLKNSNIKKAYFISDVFDEQNKNINININNNNIINIIHDNSLQNDNKYLGLNNSDEKISNLNPLNEQNIQIKELFHSQNSEKIDKLPEIPPKRFSQNVSPKIRPKDCMTFFQGEKKGTMSREKKTLLNDSINQNENLFIEASKERELYLQKSRQSEGIQNNNILNYDLDEGSEESEDDDIILEEKEPEKEEDKIICNCADILVVDDEDFNVMASQKMISKLGYYSDAAYNGEECLKLIKEKENLNCKCNQNYYQIIFLDIVMPILDGIKTAKKIQEMIDKNEINENIQIVFISGNIDDNALKESLLKIKCVKECLQKPVRVDKYQKIFEKYYKRKLI